MQTDAVIKLMRLSQAGNGIISELASTILSLVEQSRDLERRAALAEAALDHERVKWAAGPAEGQLA